MSAATHRDDAGFSLIEVIVAMALFTVLASITLGLLLQTGDVSGSSIRRTAATNLVNTQLQAARSQIAQNIPDGLQVTTSVVGGTTYTVRQTASYVSNSSSTSVCAGTGNSLAYKLVTVLVTWPNMGNVQPVRGDTLRAVGVGRDGLDAALGTAAISVTGANGQPVSGVSVTLTPGSISPQTTGVDGCAVFTGLTPATYTAQANSVGYVGPDNTQTVVASNLTVIAGGVARGALTYDTTRSVNVALTAPVGAIVPTGLALRAGNTYLPEATLPLCTPASTSGCTTGTPGSVAHLFPESYQFKLGTCIVAQPSQVAADLRPPSTNGSTVTIPVGVATVRVNRTFPPAPINGRQVTVTHAAGAGCPAGETYTMTSAAAGRNLVLPYGTWTFSTPVLDIFGLPSGTATQTITLAPAAPTAAVNLSVAL